MPKKGIYDTLSLLLFCLFFVHLQVRQVNSAVLNTFRYCDDGKIKNVSQELCPNGVNFGLGPLQPACVCISGGIYKAFTEGCEEADGFVEKEICTTLLVEQTKDSTWSMKLAAIPPNFDWKLPAITSVTSNGVWSVTNDPTPVKIKSDNFYSLNGKAYVMPDSTFCVDNVKPGKENICRYFQAANSAIWKESPEYTISLKTSCVGGKLLKEDSCFAPLTPADSECELNCIRSRTGNGTETGTGGGGTGSGTGGGGTATTRRTTKKPTKPITKEEFDKNCTNPNDYRNHDNRFLNRKMLLYNVVNQLDMRSDADKSVLQNMEPNKTLSLFDLMKNITKKVCPTEYVKSEWIDQVIDLFYILHNGNVFRYEEQLSDDQHQWIHDILTQCLDNASQITLTSMDDGTGGQCSGGASGLATGYCKHSEDSDCDYVPVTVVTDGEDSHREKHYVPEVAWNIVDAIHTACFPQFNDSYRMFHVLEQAVEKLFTLQIKNLWHHPGWQEKTKTKLLGFGADNNMYNFEVCIQGAYGLRNGDLPRLIRPFSPIYLRKKRAAAAKTDRTETISLIRRAAAAKNKTETVIQKINPASVEVQCAMTPQELRKPDSCEWDKWSIK